MTVLISYFKFNALLALALVFWRLLESRQKTSHSPGSYKSRLLVARSLYTATMHFPLVIAALTFQSPVPIGNLVPMVSAEEFAAPILLLFTLIASVVVASIVWNLHVLFREYQQLNQLLARSTILKTSGRVSLLYSDEVGVPFATGMLRNKYIVLPASLLMSREHIEYVMKHEIHHIRAGDLYWSLLARMTEVFCSWNPAATAWRKELHNAQEYACDEAIVAKPSVSKSAYVRCLHAVAEETVFRRFALSTPMSLWQGDVQDNSSKLRLRINAVYSGSSIRGTGWLSCLVVLVSLFGIALFSFGASNPAHTGSVFGEIGKAPAEHRLSPDTSSRVRQLQPAFAPNPYFPRLRKTD